jgi:predicted transcriptional regulator of viral defense system
MSDMTEILKENNYITPEIAEKHGISKYKFYKFVHDNDLEQIEHGIYVSADGWVDELYIIHQRCPDAVFSHDEALYYYGLLEREPLCHTLTTYSGYNSHRLTADGRCKVYTVKKELLEIGKTVVTDNCGNDIPMYDLERTICDMVRSRSNIEIQDFSSALKAYISKKDKNINLLMEYAALFRVQNVIRRYMEVLL